LEKAKRKKQIVFAQGKARGGAIAGLRQQRQRRHAEKGTVSCPDISNAEHYYIGRMCDRRFYRRMFSRA
jgi:hypothetical protein